MSENMTVEQELAKLRAENEALKAKNAKASTISFKVSEKGAISVYGLGRFPTTLYRQQMERLLDQADNIRAFISANEKSLKVKE